MRNILLNCFKCHKLAGLLTMDRYKDNVSNEGNVKKCEGCKFMLKALNLNVEKFNCTVQALLTTKNDFVLALIFL